MISKERGNIMIHPSYHDLMQVVNSDVEEGDAPLINSRYSIVLATAKRARQIILGSKPLVEPKCNKPLSIAVQEMYEGKVKILPEDYVPEEAAEEVQEQEMAEAEVTKDTQEPVEENIREDAEETVEATEE